MPPGEIEGHAHAKEALFRDLARSRLEPLPGLLPFLQQTEQRGLTRCLVANAPRVNVDFFLDVLQLGAYFPPSLQVVAEEKCVGRGKPHPDPYLYGL